VWILHAEEKLSENQSEELDRIYKDYAHLTDDDFVKIFLDAELKRNIQASMIQEV